MTKITSCCLLVSCLCVLFWLSLTQQLPLDHTSTAGGGPTPPSSSRRCRSFSVQYSTTTTYNRNASSATDNKNENASSSSWTVPVRGLSPLEGFQQSTCMVCPTDSDSKSSTRVKAIAHGQSSSSSRNLGGTGTTTGGGVHVVVLMGPNHPAVEKIMIVAAGLLTEGHRVTMIAGPNLRPELSVQVSAALFERIPCDRQNLAQQNFQYLGFNIPPDTRLPCRNYQQPLTDPTISPGDFVLCSTQNSLVFAQGLLPTLQALQYNPLDRADLLVMDATYIPGLLVAEYSLIPSLVLMDEARDLTQVLGQVVGISTATSAAHGGILSSSSSSNSFFGWQRIWQLIQDRFTSFELTAVFMALNRARSAMRLRRVRRLADLWMAPGSIMIATTTPLGADATTSSYYHQVNQNDLPNLLVLTSPILPPCITCSPSLPIVRPTATTTSNNNNESIPALVVTIGYPNRPQGRRRSRLIVQGMSLARASIQQFVRECQDSRSEIPRTTNGTSPLEEESPSFSCPWKGPSDFYVIQAGSSLEVLLPPFIIPETYEFMDTMCRHQSIALISLCDARTTGTHSIGLPIVCLEDHWTARDLAKEVLRALGTEREPHRPDHHQHPSHPNKNGTAGTPTTTPPPLLDALHNDGLAWIVSLAERIARITRERQHEWTNGWEMGHDILMQLNLLQLSSSDGGGGTGRYNNADSRRWRQQYHLVHLAVIIYFAWAIVVSCALYILYNEAWEQQHPSTTSRLRRSLQQRSAAASVAGGGSSSSSHQVPQLSIRSILADVMVRLPELDLLRALWSQWWTEKMSYLDESDSMANLLVRPMSLVLNSKDTAFSWGGSSTGGAKETTAAPGAHGANTMIRKQRKATKSKRH